MTTIRRKHHRQPSKLAQRRRKLLLFKIGGTAFFVLLLIIGIVFGLRMERISIMDITIEGNSAISTKSIKNFVEEKISGNYAFVFPKSSILLYPRKNLQAAIFDSFKQIKDVNISFESLQSISINVEERKPYALYCGEYVEQQIEINIDEEVEEAVEIVLEADNGCYFLDEDGFIFTKAPDFSGNVFLRYFGSLSSKVSVGQWFMQKGDFHEINFFLSSLSETGLNPIIFSIVNEDDFEIVLESGGKILFGRKQNLSDIFDNIQSVFSSKEFDKNDLSILDYADFRFGNKVYFKFK